MPIVVNRNTGEVRATRTLTPEERQKAMEAIARAYIRNHPEVLSGKENKEEHYE